MYEATNTTRIRRSPYFAAVVAEGVRGFQPYNSKLLPTGFGDTESEYWRLINNVSMWDVSVQRQVELTGPDAGALAQILTVRDLSNIEIGKGKYVALCNHDGVLINDPVLLKLADDHYWFSIADSNILLWARAIAAERKLNVTIVEPDVSPLAIQGPNAEEVVSHLLGGWVRSLRYFWFKETVLEGIPLIVARSGWSKQGGFELYLRDGKQGLKLWNIVKEAGKRWDIGPGNPNVKERIESGLLSFGGDTDDETNPFEVRMERFVDLDLPDTIIGATALTRIHKEGVKRHQLGIKFGGPPIKGAHALWYDILYNGQKIGDLTCGTYSLRLKSNIGFGLVLRERNVGDQVHLAKDGQLIEAEMCSLPFC